MWISEQILYALAKALYRTEIAQSTEHKKALQSDDDCDAYRHAGLDAIVSRANDYGVSLDGKSVIDLGCNHGAVSVGYFDKGATSVIGVDIDASAIQRAQQLRTSAGVSFVLSTPEKIPLEDESSDLIISRCAFEHISNPAVVLKELYRILKPTGQILIGTNGWYHPFAPHLWATMPVPWAHVLFSERTILRVCRRVYLSSWYIPSPLLDFDPDGNMRTDKYLNEKISTDSLNKLLIRDFERIFKKTNFRCKTHLVPFGSKYARFTKAFLHFPYLREFLAGHTWFVLSKG